jgi:vacuolar-type H+-ATPase subunit H
MGKCNWCGAEVERDKLFAHQWEKHRGEMIEQRRKQGATSGKKARQTAQQEGAAMSEAATPNLVQAAMMEFVVECAHY